MRPMVLLATWTLIGAALIAFGIYLVVPGRNLHGDPRAEIELASCTLPDDARVRLYEGDSAATNNWFSVTHDPPGPQRERQIIFQRSPGLYDLVCDSAGLLIRTGGAPISLTAEQAVKLREWTPRASTVGLARWVAGGLLVLAGAALLYFLRPKGGEDDADEPAE